MDGGWLAEGNLISSAWLQPAFDRERLGCQPAIHGRDYLEAHQNISVFIFCDNHLSTQITGRQFTAMYYHRERLVKIMAVDWW